MLSTIMFSLAAFAINCLAGLYAICPVPINYHREAYIGQGEQPTAVTLKLLRVLYRVIAALLFGYAVTMAAMVYFTLSVYPIETASVLGVGGAIMGLTIAYQSYSLKKAYNVESPGIPALILTVIVIIASGFAMSGY